MFTMKALAIVAASLSLAQALTFEGIVDFPEDLSANPDYEYMRELGISPELEFELMVKQGIDPRGGAVDLRGFSGEADVEDLSLALENSPDREAKLFNICGGIEKLFSGNVACTCNNPILALGVISFECSYLSEITRREFSYTPTFDGAFAFRIFAIDYAYTGSSCAEEVRYYSSNVKTELLLGDFCFIYDLELKYVNRKLLLGLAGCEVTLGSLFGSCNTCTPCTTARGAPGVELDCTLISDQGGSAACIPVALPTGTSSSRVNGSNFFSNLNLSKVIKAAEDKYKAEQAKKPVPTPTARKPATPTAPVRQRTGAGRNPN